MTCHWYDENYKLSTCTYSVGDACCDCPCEGETSQCPYKEFGRSIAVEKGN